jgi:hypothetical protein
MCKPISVVDVIHFFAGGDMEFSETLGFDAHTHSARILCGLYSQQGVDLGPNTSWKSNPGNLIWIFFFMARTLAISTE